MLEYDTERELPQTIYSSVAETAELPLKRRCVPACSAPATSSTRRCCRR